MLHILTYVDDMLVISKSLEVVMQAKEYLRSKCETHDLGEVSHFLGMKVTRDWERGVITLSNKVKILELLESFQMTDCAPKATPMDRSFVVTKKEAAEMVEADGNYNRGAGKLLPKRNRYEELLGSLNYLAITTRPDISNAVSILSRFKNAPTTAHWEAGKRVLAYLKGTADLGLTYGGGQSGIAAYVDANFIGDQQVEVYVDADYAGCLDTRKSTSGFVFKINGGAVNWGSKKQKSVASSTVESEYIAFHAVGKEVKWMRGLLIELGEKPQTITVQGDNKGCLSNLMNPMPSSHVKHIDVSYHMVRELVATGMINPVYVASAANVADIFTKALDRAKFEKFRKELGLR